MESKNHDQLIEDFKSCTGVEDPEVCRSHLEAADWDLLAAINRVTPLETQRLPADAGGSPDVMVTGVRAGAGRPRSPDVVVAPPEPTPASTQAFNFAISAAFLPDPLLFTLFDTDTVGTLKDLIYKDTGIPTCQLDLQGWPPDSGSDSPADSASLGRLHLLPDTELFLLQRRPSSSSDSSFVSFRSAMDSAPQTSGTGSTGTKEQGSSEVEGDVRLVIRVASPPKEIRMSYAKTTLVQQVKEDMARLCEIPPPVQVWSGWPPDTTDESPLGSLNLVSPHSLGLSLLADETTRSFVPASSSRPMVDMETNTAPLEDLSVTDAHSDSSVEDTYLPLDDSLDPVPLPPPGRDAPLIPPNTDSEMEGVVRFQAEFLRRYGPHIPGFFPGTLEDALNHSLNVLVSDRRPLALYLHHDKSILVNVFCSQVLCAETMIDFLTSHFTLWGWDLTDRGNRERVVDSVTRFFGQMAASTLSSIPVESLPALVLITKFRGNFEVVSVVRGDSSADDVMSSLVAALEVFHDQQQESMREEQERAARNQVKREQDEAFERSLAADRAKEIERQEKAAQERAVERAKEEKEAERVRLKHSLPAEPEGGEPGIVELRFRVPAESGRPMLQRRFRASSPLKDVLMFLEAEGFSMDEYKVLTAFPKRVISESEPNQALSDLKLHSHETLIVAFNS